MKLPAILGNCGRQIGRPTDRTTDPSTNQPTDGHREVGKGEKMRRRKIERELQRYLLDLFSVLLTSDLLLAGRSEGKGRKGGIGGK